MDEALHKRAKDILDKLGLDDKRKRLRELEAESMKQDFGLIRKRLPKR